MDTDIDKKLEDHIKLIEGHARVALKKIRKPARCNLDDLIQEGAVAFLNAKKAFIEGGSTSFRTYLTKCLRNHFTNLVKQTYRNKEVDNLSSWDNFQVDKFSSEMNSMDKRNTVPDTLKTVQVFFIIRSFNNDELEYVNTMLSLVHKSRGGRRKTARRDLGISYERETELRNSIRDKIRK